VGQRQHRCLLTLRGECVGGSQGAAGREALLPGVGGHQPNEQRAQGTACARPTTMAVRVSQQAGLQRLRQRLGPWVQAPPEATTSFPPGLPSRSSKAWGARRCRRAQQPPTVAAHQRAGSSTQGST
jgi:hypothetical protein